MENKYLEEVLKEMCSRVGADFDKINFKEDGWFMKYSWTEDEEADFKKWLANYLKDRKAMMSLYQSSTTNKYFREKAADAFIFNYGWKLKLKKKLKLKNG